MHCRNPFKAKMSKRVNGQILRPDAPIINVGCGRCLWCRIQRRREWTLRLLFENENHKNKSHFLTLTYNENSNPITIDKRTLQLFFKSLRKQYGQTKIRYYAIGEYTDEMRPHYHIILFGLSSRELQVYWDPSIQRHQSKILLKMWEEKGFHDVGTVTIESIQYVAGYVHKKLYGPDKYPAGITPPFALMSKLIGYQYYSQTRLQTVIEDGKLIIRGNSVNIPRAFIRKMKRENDHFHNIVDKIHEGKDWQQTLDKIKRNGIDNFRSRIFKHIGVGHENDMTYDDHKKLDRIMKNEADAIDYHLKQYHKSTRGKSKL